MMADLYSDFLTALAVWREARGECRDAKAGVYNVIKNRVAMGRWGKNAAEVVMYPKQFSSFNSNDPNASRLPMPNDPSWRECCDVVDSAPPDNTEGATHYYSPMPKPPAWADANRMTVQIGAFKFFKLP